MVNNYPGRCIWPNKGPALCTQLAHLKRLLTRTKQTGQAMFLLCLFWGGFTQAHAQCDVVVNIPANTCLGQPFTLTFDASASTSPTYPILVDYTVGGVAQPQISMTGATATATFTPSLLGSLDVEITTATDATPVSCSLGAIATTVVASPSLTFSAPADLCINDPILSAGGATPTGGVYSGPGVTDDANGTSYTFDPATAGVGTKTLTYSYTDVNGCSNTITDDVEVFEEPTVG